MFAPWHYKHKITYRGMKRFSENAFRMIWTNMFPLKQDLWTHRFHAWNKQWEKHKEMCGVAHLDTAVSRLFTQQFIQAEIKENIKAPRHWPLWGEFTGDRWIPHTKGQWRGKCFHLMTSSCELEYILYAPKNYTHGSGHGAPFTNII